MNKTRFALAMIFVSVLFLSVVSAEKFTYNEMRAMTPCERSLTYSAVGLSGIHSAWLQQLPMSICKDKIKPKWRFLKEETADRLWNWYFTVHQIFVEQEDGSFQGQKQLRPAGLNEKLLEIGVTPQAGYTPQTETTPVVSNQTEI